MKIAVTSATEKNFIIHSNTTGSIDLIDSYDSSYTVTENQTSTPKSFFAVSKQEQFNLFLTAFRILWSKYHYSSEPLTCLTILIRIDPSNTNNKKILETRIDFPTISTTVSTSEMVFSESKKIFRNHQIIVDQFSVSDSYEFNLIALNTESEKVELDCTIRINQDIYFSFKVPFDSQLADVVSNSERHFLKILNTIQQSPDRNVADILIHDTEELDYLLQWSEGEYDPSLSQPDCLYQFFEQTAITFPDLPAVFSNGKSFTYKEIDNKANQLARYLFEDRVMKMSVVDIEKHCTVGAMSVVLYDSKMGNHSVLDGLSLLMKGETLPACTKWQGSPSGRIN